MNSYASSLHAFAPSRTDKGMLIAGLRVLVVFVALLMYAVVSADLSTNSHWITNSQGLAAYTLLLLGYLCVETRMLWTREPRLLWMNPAVLASLFTFVLPFGVTNILFFMPEDVVAEVGLQPITTRWMNQLMLLVVLGACAMWTGYNSGIGRSMGTMLRRSSVLRRWMTTSYRVNRPALYACLAISLAARLAEIKLGIYGYSGNHARVIAAAAYTQYFYIAESLGELALMGVALQCFAPPHPALPDRLLLWLVLGYEVAFGFLTGMKSQVGMPFIIVAFVYYSQRNRFPRWLVPAVLVSVIAAYAVIEPFRAVRNRDKEFTGNSLGSIVETMMNAKSIQSDDSGEGASTWISVLSRMNLTYIGSLGIEYAAENKTLPEGSPDFLGNIIAAPAEALIPRFLWSSKSLQNIGVWYTHQVMGLESIVSSTGMSAFTYLNFAGGPLAVVLGFLLVGVLQRGLFDGLRHFGGGGLIVLFGLLNTLQNIDSAYYTFFIAIIRFFPLLIAAQYLLLQRSHRSCAE